jgi:hypothetical protein
MSSSVTATAIAGMSTRKCSFCAEEILADAKKCKHCGEFVNETISKSVGAIFAVGVVVACSLFDQCLIPLGLPQLLRLGCKCGE